MILTQKRRLRLHILQQTALVPPSEKLRQSHKAFALLENTDLFRGAANIGLFWSLSDEIPTQWFLDKWAARKNIYLPVVDRDRMHFARYTPGCKMTQGGLRILVPEGTPFIDPEQLDLVLVPGIAFDPAGARLGRGKGYYDRYFESCPAPRIGVCLEHQLTGAIPEEAHDRKMDMVLTASRIYYSGQKEATVPCPGAIATAALGTSA